MTTNATQADFVLWAVVPAKALNEGKSRLAPVVDPAGREQLNRCFLRRTVSLVADLDHLAGVVVVSGDLRALDEARSLGAETLREPSPGDLNQALGLGARWAAQRGATHVMTISTDLPWLTEAELCAVIEQARAAPGPSVTLAPDQSEEGTNVMVVSPAGAIAYAYGLGSFARHRANAVAARAKVTVVRRPGLSFDVDSPADYERWRAGLSACGGDPKLAGDACVNDA